MEVQETRLHRAAGWLATVVVPVVLAVAVVRLLLTPAFVRLEYRTPNFPSDPYGFTLEDRLRWAPLAREYLLNDAGISFLGDLRLSDGTSLYDSRELRHMEDVKVLVGQALAVWYGAMVALLVLGVWAWRGTWWTSYRRALARGGWLAVILVGVVVLVILLSFGPLFVFFHRVFFQGDSWLFDYSTTLIRLFPMRFWRDAFMLVGVLTLGAGLALGLLAASPKETQTGSSG